MTDVGTRPCVTLRDDVPAVDVALWNVASDVPALVGAAETFAVVGHVHGASDRMVLSYRLNGGCTTPVVVRPRTAPPTLQRLNAPGDFAIDTISSSALGPENELELTVEEEGVILATHRTRFAARPWSDVATLSESLIRASRPQQVAQLVDGRWVVATDEDGRKCLRVGEDDAGLDRIVLLGPPVDWVGRTVTARLRVRSWTRSLHNVGLLFDWRGHRIGDGAALPPEWTTGLAYYYSKGAGLRLRLGEDVHYDADGHKLGDRLLGEGPVTPARARVARATRRLGGGTLFRQIPPGIDHWFQARLAPDGYALTVWRDGRPQPGPQVVARAPVPAPLSGAAGIIAHYCAVDVSEFHVRRHDA